MTSINISELTYSSLAEINMDEMNLIRGGKITIGVDRGLLGAIPDLTGLKALVLTGNIFEEIDSMSFNDIKEEFDFFAVAPIPVESPRLSIRSPRPFF